MKTPDPVADTTAVLRRHYAALKLDRGWDVDRFTRLCRRLQYLPGEMAELLCIEPRELRGWVKRGRFPRCVSLLFTLLDDAAVWRESGRSGRVLIPLENRGAKPSPPQHD